MSKIPLFIIVLILLTIVIGGYRYFGSQQLRTTDIPNMYENEVGAVDLNPLTIERLRKGTYPGSGIVIEETLEPGSNYNQYIASYQSESLKIYGHLTVPKTEKPANGFPAIVFNHGYIPSKEYRTTEGYVAYVDGFARNGYIVFRPDYRGHDKSEGEASSAYGSNGYTIDVLNAVSSVKKLSDANPEKIGMWGHSMGGYITLRNMVVRQDIKAGIIWAGVVGSYTDLLRNWRRRGPTRVIPTGARSWRLSLVEQYGQPEENPLFWNSISANAYVKDISGPLQLHHGTADTSVPVEFSEQLAQQLQSAKKTVELYTYPDDDHNLSANFNTAMTRSVEFFDRYLK